MLSGLIGSTFYNYHSSRFLQKLYQIVSVFPCATNVYNGSLTCTDILHQVSIPFLHQRIIVLLLPTNHREKTNLTYNLFIYVSLTSIFAPFNSFISSNERPQSYITHNYYLSISSSNLSLLQNWSLPSHKPPFYIKSSFNSIIIPQSMFPSSASLFFSSLHTIEKELSRHIIYTPVFPSPPFCSILFISNLQRAPHSYTTHHYYLSISFSNLSLLQN